VAREGNVPHHGHGPKGKPKRMGGLMGVGAHMPQRVNKGESDRHGYEGSEGRKNGRHTGKPAKPDSRRRYGPEGNGKGSPPTKMGSRGAGSPSGHMGTSGRGGPGKVGKGDSYKGKPTAYSEDISHSQFEKLGC